MKSSALTLFALLVCAVPALASVTINSPSEGSLVVSPFSLNATATSCGSQPVTGMVYWLDDAGRRPAFSWGSSLAAQVTARLGSHATVPGEFSLGWGSVLSTNFQVDGLGGYGSVTACLDKLTVYRW